MGNHDQPVLDEHLRLGAETCQTAFLAALRPYYVEDGRLFIHGGFDPRKPFETQDEYDYSGSRHLPQMAWRAHQNGETFEIPGFREAYVGHTRTQVFGRSIPFRLGNLWMMDTGAALRCGGFLSLMDVESKEFWQSPTS
jgi:serine/threonine protein phosphatase 1